MREPKIFKQLEKKWEILKFLWVVEPVLDVSNIKLSENKLIITAKLETDLDKTAFSAIRVIGNVLLNFDTYKVKKLVISKKNTLKVIAYGKKEK